MEKKISKKTLSKAFHNWYYGHLTCFSQEHMQTFGYLCSMLPIVEELYETLIIEQQHAKAKSRSFDRCKNCTLQNNCGQGCLSFIK